MRVPNLCCIYAIISPSGRVYIGQTRNVNQRWRHHRNDRRSNGPLQRSLAKYGFRAHAFAVLVVFDSEEDQLTLNTAERQWVKSCADSGLPLLNLTEGGDNARLSDEHKNKIRLALIGIKRSDETKRRISEGKKGEVHTEEHKRLVSERMKGRPATWLKGKKLSPETIAERVARQTGRKLSAEHRESMRLGQLRRWEQWRSDRA